MAFDFPSTPNVGDLFQDSTSGAVYRWNGYAWVGGVTGLGLQTIKDTRYLAAGSFTHTRDSKSNGLADIWLLGGCGGRTAVTWASGQAVTSSGPGGGAITIKWKYALPASAPVVVGAGGVPPAVGGASSFDTSLTAAGGASSQTQTGATSSAYAVPGGVGGAAGTSGDENYAGLTGGIGTWNNGVWYPGSASLPIYLRDCARYLFPPANSIVASIGAVNGPAGFVMVREYLNP